MDYLIFFKENQSLKDTIDRIRFSFTRTYTSYYPTRYEQIARVLQKSREALLFYFSESLSDTDRIRIKSLLADFPDMKICLLSDQSFALDAWHLNVFHFEAYPVSASKISNSYRKYVHHLGGEARELVVKTYYGTEKIPFSSINYLEAAGNYTTIFQKNDKKTIQTKQLGTYEFITERDMYFNRVHRSLIVNFRNIKSIGGRKLSFYNTEKTLPLSEALESKIKKTILGK